MKRISSQTLLGIIILLFGILFLLRNLEVYDTGLLLQYIPSFFILVGLYALFKSRFSSITGPAILILIATFIQLIVLDIITWSDIFVWWPIILIVIGIDILLHRKRRSCESKRSRPKIDITAIFDDVNLVNNSKEFKEGDITVFLGDSELDLRDAEVDPSPAKINVTVLLGDADLIIPRYWNVEIDVINILGDIYDKRSNNSELGESAHDKPDLIITGILVLGDLTINQR
ncbi:cell wall-active antibiotics response protein [Methanosalsum natronophilum]|uniref:cell wall-active antibiotics response protein n=1 Tax=Methanosalsum natronophilum TaxID=768733 RepID=UPI002169DD45|nr:cell wall-active antibiotics response protein [Methanosalsum natronophilum]MCS3924455.1 putative membrane protein [Methanosalsum natronophilum]